jgi:UDP-2,4-diacetamido-2,4,6-trideoxy-beta-L-altropyranose hydrolase
MDIAFRADASILIGTGHVMRCLTLAHALKKKGGECIFICRELPGHLAEQIRADGIKCVLLPPPDKDDEIKGPPAHAAWAGVTWQRDAQDTRRALDYLSPDWLIVDHYAFDTRWEEAVKPAAAKLFVIDDLADSPHVCDLLLDQNLGREARDYDGRVPVTCQRLIGPQYALLRPEFAALRPKALSERRARLPHGIKNLLISMGGMDWPDATSAVLEALPQCDLPSDTKITVVMGGMAPALDRVRERVAALPCEARLLTDVKDMARLMAQADLAIGAVGSTSWERCCLGLPTLTLVIADNQEPTAKALEQAGAAISLGLFTSAGKVSDLRERLSIIQALTTLRDYAEKAASVTDGLGLMKILEVLNAGNEHSNGRHPAELCE